MYCITLLAVEKGTFLVHNFLGKILQKISSENMDDKFQKSSLSRPSISEET